MTKNEIQIGKLYLRINSQRLIRVTGFCTKSGKDILLGVEVRDWDGKWIKKPRPADVWAYCSDVLSHTTEDPIDRAERLRAIDEKMLRNAY